MQYNNISMYNARIRSGQQVVVDLGTAVLDTLSGASRDVLSRGLDLTNQTIDTYTHLTTVIKRKSASIDPTIVGKIKKKNVLLHNISPGMARASATHPEVLEYYRSMGVEPGGYKLTPSVFNGLTIDQCLATTGIPVTDGDVTKVTQYILNDPDTPAYSVDDRWLINCNNRKIDSWLSNGSTVEERFGGEVIYF